MDSHTSSSEDLSSIFGGWMLFCKELVMDKDSPQINMQLITINILI